MMAKWVASAVLEVPSCAAALCGSSKKQRPRCAIPGVHHHRPWPFTLELGLFQEGFRLWCSNSGTHFAAKANVCFWYTDSHPNLQGDASGATILSALKDKLSAAARPYTEADSGPGTLEMYLAQMDCGVEMNFTIMSADPGEHRHGPFFFGNHLVMAFMLLGCVPRPSCLTDISPKICFSSWLFVLTFSKVLSFY